MPLNIDWQQILLHLLNFAILAGGLYFLLYKPVKQFMDSRKAHYEQMEAQAKEALRQAEKAKLEADQAQAGLADTLRRERTQAMAALEKDSQKKVSQAEGQARQILEDARKAAALRQQKAVKESDRMIRELAISAAEKLALQGDPYDQFLQSANGRDPHGERT